MTNQAGKRFYSLNDALYEQFGSRVAKLSLNAGLTCPTRDGAKGYGGCLFCSASGSGDFISQGSVQEQMEQQAKLLSRKWDTQKYIAYFQSFTNTYASPARLESIWQEALGFPGTVGLAVATRPDCLSDPIISLLQAFNLKTYFWLEMGLQTIHNSTGNLIRRGFSTEDFDKKVLELNEKGIRIVCHVIVGLPGEGRQEFLDTVKHVSSLPIWGIKIHMLHILKFSALYDYYQANRFDLPDLEAYTEWVCDALEILRPDIVIHRLTGDGDRKNLYLPLWTANKLKVLSEIDRELARRKSYQGKYGTRSEI